MKTNNCKAILVLLFLSIFSFQLNSAGLHSIHYTYRHLNGNTWELSCHAYINCDYYGSFSNAAWSYHHDTCNYQLKTISYGPKKLILPNGKPFGSNCYANYCPSTLTMCDSPFNATGLRAWRHVLYMDTITLPEACGLWKFSLGSPSSAAWRDKTITNIADSSHTGYFEAILNADSTKPNSSANWLRPMFMYACANDSTQWHLPVIDPDGDSLVYSLVPSRERDVYGPDPLDTLIFDIPLLPQYSLTTEPFATNETWRFYPEIPKVTFYGLPNQLALLTFRVEEYRQGVYMGATFRDVLINTIACANKIPQRTIDTASLQQVTLSNTDTVEVYAGQSINLCNYYTSANTALSHESNIPSLLQGASYTASYVGGADTLKTCLQWTPTLADTGIYLLVTTVQDTSCLQANPKIPQDYFHRLIVHGFPATVTNTNTNGNIIIYPNPTHHKLYIQNATPYSIKQLYNSVGKLILHTTTNEMNVQQCSAGLYYLKCEGQVVKVRIE